MQKLSIQEQRKIIGGGWGFKAYDESGNLVYLNFSFRTSSDATSERNSIMKAHPRWNVFDVELR